MAKSVRDEYRIDSSLIRLTPKCLAVRSGDIRVSTHAYHFLAGTDPAKSPLVLLHGSGGDEHDLMPLAEELAPGSPILGVRGTIAIDGGCAFFHRLLDRSIDEADITARTPVLAEFIQAPWSASASPGRLSPSPSPMVPSWRRHC
jgi:hypothetical protein